MAIPSLNIGGGKWATKKDKLLAYKQNIGGRYFAINGDTSRNSTATFTNQNGLIDSVGNNVARVDFQDDVKGSLLLEPQSTNLITQSESFANSYWIKSGASIEGDPSTVGAEEVVNGDFATDLTGWIDSTADTFEQVSSWQGESGLIHVVTSAANRGARQTSVYTLGVDYLFTAKLWIVSGSVYFGKNSDKIGLGDYSTTGEWIDVSVYFNPSEDDTLRIYTVGSGEFYLDNVSVKEVQGFASPSLDSPTGAFKLVEDTSTGHHSVYLIDKSPSDSNIYTRSFYVKKDNSRYLFISARHIPTSSGTTWIYDFDINDWANTASGGSGQSIEVLQNGWIRLSVSHISNSNFNNDFSLGISSGAAVGDASYTGDGTSGVYIFGAQLEALPYATSYIPTSGSAVTRVKDGATITGFSNYINSEEGALFVELKTFSELGTYRQIALSFDNSYRIYISKRANNGKLEFRTNNPLGDTNNSITVNTTNNYVKVAYRWGLNNFGVFIDGVDVTINNLGNTFESGKLNKLEFTSIFSQDFIGDIKQLQVYKEALTDSELITLTTI